MFLKCVLEIVTAFVSAAANSPQEQDEASRGRIKKDSSCDKSQHDRNADQCQPEKDLCHRVFLKMVYQVRAPAVARPNRK